MSKGYIEERVSIVNGRRVVRYRARVRLKGVATTMTFKSRTQAEAWCKQESKRILAEDTVGILEPERYSKRTLKEAIESYREMVLPRLTSRKNLNFLVDEVDRLLGHLKLTDVDCDTIEVAVRKYQAGGRRGRKGSSANKFVNTVSAIFRQARKKGWTTAQPTKDVKRFPESQFERTRCLSEEERGRLFQAINRSICPMLGTIVWVALLTGYRKDWIRHLKWDYIKWDRAFIQLPPGQINPRGEPGKNTNKAMPIVPQLLQMLKRHKQMLDALGVSSPFVFPSFMDPTKPVDFSKAFENAVKRAGIKDFKFHDLRHTAATELIMKGVSPRVVQDTLGHKDQRSTVRYTHVPSDFIMSEMKRAFNNIVETTVEVQNAKK